MFSVGVHGRGILNSVLSHAKKEEGVCVSRGGDMAPVYSSIQQKPTLNPRTRHSAHQQHIGGEMEKKRKRPSQITLCRTLTHFICYTEICTVEGLSQE